jgi:SAM-dependent methyltransferase
MVLANITRMTPHAAIYSSAELYDLAFSYRDFAAECRFLSELYRARRGRDARTFLELAAGPSRHALQLAAAGLSATALDSVSQMAAFAERRAQARGLPLSYLVADMTDFHGTQRFDLAACLLCSASYLLRDEQVLSHLACVHEALADDGLYVLELTHPAELSGQPKSQTRWNMRDERGELEIDWAGDPARSENGIWQTHVTLRFHPADGSAAVVIEDHAAQRGFGYEELRRLAEQSGFLVEGAFGTFDPSVALDSPQASRMLIALGKRPRGPQPP